LNSASSSLGLSIPFREVGAAMAILAVCRFGSHAMKGHSGREQMSYSTSSECGG
jgi:hypothetical protein